MAKAIEIKEIARLLRHAVDGSVDKPKLTLSFRAFEQLLYSNEVCTDPRTVKQKWNILLAKGVIFKLGKEDYKVGLLDIMAFNTEWPDLAIEVRLPDSAHTHSTHTYLSTEGVQ